MFCYSTYLIKRSPPFNSLGEERAGTAKKNTKRVLA